MPPSLPRVPWVHGSPRSAVLRGTPTPFHPSPAAPLPSPRGTCALTPGFAPGRADVAHGRHGRSVCGAPTRKFTKEMKGSPRFLGNPMRACPALRPRRDRGTSPLQPLDVAFRLHDGVGSHKRHFVAQSRSPHARCLRFAPAVTRRHARLASGCLDGLPGGGGYPLGSSTRFIRSSCPPRPGLAWRTTNQSG